jgi:hypothetical protein
MIGIRRGRNGLQMSYRRVNILYQSNRVYVSLMIVRFGACEATNAEINLVLHCSH